ncbi:response regulator [Marinobacter sp. M216]|uniref:Response regulator n=1 Tax=Marinobacter albus TaxID=3030833 RepID=A0ABT7H764_9GAMM|nr:MULTISPECIES: response regulator [unclassified Marinobacter]MBW7471518.1 response regulator [Marinobacter sp. F4218]MDK9556203.1 response regulator [Marinobacter sp. M216]
MDDYSILVVEDNPDDQVLTMRALRNASRYNPIIMLEDGQEALDFLFGTETRERSEQVESIGVVLLDFKLPKVSGLEVLRRIRSSPKTDWIPVVMVTSSDEPQELREAYRLGANSFVTKQIDYSKFSEQMSLLARYWLTVNRVPVMGVTRSFQKGGDGE